MKIIIVQFILLTECVCALCAQDVRFRPLTGKESVEVKQKLESFDKGTATLDSLTDSQEWTMKLLEYYVMHTNKVTTKMKLPIAKSYAVWGKYPEAVTLAQDYVNVYSNDWRGWRVLGGCKLITGSYSEALDALTNAVCLGDKQNYAALGFAALKVDRLDVFKSMVAPYLLMLINNTEQFPEKERNQMRGLLIAYALKIDNKPIFIKAIAGFDLSTISQWEELKDLIVQGCDRFKGTDIDKIRKELETNVGESINSTSTNAPPPAK